MPSPSFATPGQKLSHSEGREANGFKRHSGRGQWGWQAGIFLTRVNHGIHRLLPHLLLKVPIPASQLGVSKAEKGLALPTSNWHKETQNDPPPPVVFSISTKGNFIFQVLRPNTWEDPGLVFPSHPQPHPTFMQTLSVLPSEYIPDPTTSLHHSGARQCLPSLGPLQ